MKKVIALVLMAVMLSSIALAYVNPWASGAYGSTSSFGSRFSIKLVQKDPSTWQQVDGASGLLQGMYGSRLVLLTTGLDRNKDYTLVYYGDDTYNDQWPYVTCIKSVSHYWSRTTASFNYKPFLNDGVDQKFWVVLSEDLDCDAGQFVAWNPTEYLFEEETI